ncbi:hypothetical protein DUNSADRAFT_10019, partial [Dunaliella salina]
PHIFSRMQTVHEAGSERSQSDPQVFRDRPSRERTDIQTGGFANEGDGRRPFERAITPIYPYPHDGGMPFAKNRLSSAPGRVASPPKSPWDSSRPGSTQGQRQPPHLTLQQGDMPIIVDHSLNHGPVANVVPAGLLLPHSNQKRFVMSAPRPRANPAGATAHATNPRPKSKLQHGEGVRPGSVLGMESPRTSPKDPEAVLKKAWDCEGEGRGASLPADVPPGIKPIHTGRSKSPFSAEGAQKSKPISPYLESAHQLHAHKHHPDGVGGANTKPGNSTSSTPPRSRVTSALAVAVAGATGSGSGWGAATEAGVRPMSGVPRSAVGNAVMGATNSGSGWGAATEAGVCPTSGVPRRVPRSAVGNAVIGATNGSSGWGAATEAGIRPTSGVPRSAVGNAVMGATNSGSGWGAATEAGARPMSGVPRSRVGSAVASSAGSGSGWGPAAEAGIRPMSGMPRSRAGSALIMGGEGNRGGVGGYDGASEWEGYQWQAPNEQRLMLPQKLPQAGVQGDLGGDAKQHQHPHQLGASPSLQMPHQHMPEVLLSRDYGRPPQERQALTVEQRLLALESRSKKLEVQVRALVRHIGTSM